VFRQSLRKLSTKRSIILKKDEDKIKKVQEDLKNKAWFLLMLLVPDKEREIQEMMMGLQNKTMEYQREIQKLEQEMKKPILRKTSSSY
jgi:outer membrane protein